MYLFHSRNDTTLQIFNEISIRNSQSRLSFTFALIHLHPPYPGRLTFAIYTIQLHQYYSILDGMSSRMHQNYSHLSSQLCQASVKCQDGIAEHASVANNTAVHFLFAYSFIVRITENFVKHSE